MKALKKTSLMVIAMTVLSLFISCGEAPEEDGISWDSEPSGLLKIANNTTKDMVVFNGQTPSVNTILGGIRAGQNRTFDLSDDVDDYDVGGYLILRAMEYDEFIAKKDNLAAAKIDFSAMATYGPGKKYSAEISPNYSGDYYYKVTNSGKIGIELRKDSPDGEKIGYLPALATNYTLYAGSSDALSIFPVYVYFSRATGTVTTIKAKDHFDSVTVAPRPVTDASVAHYELPAQGINWDDIVGELTSPVAYVTCTNNVANQAAYFTKASTTVLKAQNNYDALNSGETNTFEIASTDAGTDHNLIVTLYNKAIKVPVKDADGNAVPIKNGYDYTLSITYNGAGVQDSSNYSAVITEVGKRDISNEIESL